MTPEFFADLAEQGYNHIPVTREVLADLDTPLSTYLKLADGPYSYLLESALGGERWGRYSIVGLPCRTIVKVFGHKVVVERDGEISETLEAEDPLSFIEDMQRNYKAPSLPELPLFTGGLVGYFGYDTIRYVEKRVRDTQPPDDIETPDILLMVSNDVIIFDSLRGKLHLVSHVDPNVDGIYETTVDKLDQLVAKLSAPIPREKREPAVGPYVHEEDFVSSYGKDNYQTDVERIKEYILAGDVMQVVLAQRMSMSLEADPLDVYRALRSLNPSPYMYHMNLGDFHIVSSSPEILARLDHGQVTVRPLAGTRRRGVDDREDMAMEQELLADPKEIAEHLMLIDLGRNDIGRVCQIGSVEVKEMMAVERYSHVMHIASHVTGTILPDKHAMDLLRATLPVGTLSGAPKIRAMEIIDELEPVKRGIFGGAVGYLSWNGNMDTAIAIRTAVIKQNKLYIQAGAGVVADSIPALEWKETINKARAIFRAAAMAEGGLNHEPDALENPRVHDKEASRDTVTR
jgi:anthranilate synthase component 1